MAYGNGGAQQGYSVPSINTPAPRISIISEQVVGLEKRIEELHGLISELDGRLHLALMPEPPANNKDASVVPHPGVPLGGQLATQNERLSAACMRLRQLIDRVEL